MNNGTHVVKYFDWGQALNYYQLCSLQNYTIIKIDYIFRNFRGQEGGCASILLLLYFESHTSFINRCKRWKNFQTELWIHWQGILGNACWVYLGIFLLPYMMSLNIQGKFKIAWFMFRQTFRLTTTAIHIFSCTKCLLIDCTFVIISKDHEINWIYCSKQKKRQIRYSSVNVRWPIENSTKQLD